MSGKEGTRTAGRQTRTGAARTHTKNSCIMAAQPRTLTILGWSSALKRRASKRSPRCRLTASNASALCLSKKWRAWGQAV